MKSSFAGLLLLLIAIPRAQAQPTIEWDAATLRLIERRGEYGRMARLGDGGIACVFDRDRKMWIRHSSDEGVTWGEPNLVAEERDCWLTNADLLPLKNGALLYFWNERPVAALKFQDKPAPPGTLTRPFLIRMSRSADAGRTWSPPQTIYAAGPSYQDGCWEPAAIELPSGEVQVFFANESPFRTTTEQEISRARSTDGGKTWSDPERVSFRPRYRDGMPAPLLLASGQIIVAIEDNGLSGPHFKPAFVQVPLGERWSALKEPLDPNWYGGAPCLRQLPTGEMLLSYQESDDGSLNRCRLVVCVGDSNARNFTNKTYPLPALQRDNQAWNALFVKTADTVTAITTATIDGKRGIWAIDGRVKRTPR